MQEIMGSFKEINSTGLDWEGVRTLAFADWEGTGTIRVIERKKSWFERQG